ncbi:MAG: helix-turn-helix domain-containing protein [Pseudomonadota bacterium]|nr:helix-turn-helix domain-containing protein [Pseudomonadota bacterium]
MTGSSDHQKEFTVSVETLVSHGQALEQYLRDRGDYESLLQTFGEEVKKLAAFNPRQRVPVDTIARNIDTLAQWINEPYLGLKLAPYSVRRQQRLALFFTERELPLLDYLRLLARYACISSEVMRMELETTQQHIILRLTPNSPQGISRHQIEGFVASIHAIVNQARGLLPRCIDFSHPLPDPAGVPQLYTEVLGVTPGFGQSHNRLVYPNQQRDQYTLPQRPGTAGFAHLQAMEAVKRKEIGAENWASRCRFLLEILLYYGEPNKSLLAELLAVTPRTLQRHLEAEGTGFRPLLADLRQQLALDYLAKEQFNNEDIAFLLGYQDVGRFFKAFKSWYGITPGQYRASHPPCPPTG